MVDRVPVASTVCNQYATNTIRRWLVLALVTLDRSKKRRRSLMLAEEFVRGSAGGRTTCMRESARQIVCVHRSFRDTRQCLGKTTPCLRVRAPLVSVFSWCSTRRSTVCRTCSRGRVSGDILDCSSMKFLGGSTLLKIACAAASGGIRLHDIVSASHTHLTFIATSFFLQQVHQGDTTDILHTASSLLLATTSCFHGSEKMVPPLVFPKDSRECRSLVPA